MSYFYALRYIERNSHLLDLLYGSTLNQETITIKVDSHSFMSEVKEKKNRKRNQKVKRQVKGCYCCFIR